jgi:hypothetical protein
MENEDICLKSYHRVKSEKLFWVSDTSLSIIHPRSSEKLIGSYIGVGFIAQLNRAGAEYEIFFCFMI